jgi:hypothetical protein
MPTPDRMWWRLPHMGMIDIRTHIHIDKRHSIKEEEEEEEEEVVVVVVVVAAVAESGQGLVLTRTL